MFYELHNIFAPTVQLLWLQLIWLPQFDITGWSESFVHARINPSFSTFCSFFRFSSSFQRFWSFLVFFLSFSFLLFRLSSFLHLCSLCSTFLLLFSAVLFLSTFSSLSETFCFFQLSVPHFSTLLPFALSPLFWHSFLSFIFLLSYCFRLSFSSPLCQCCVLFLRFLLSFSAFLFLSGLPTSIWLSLLCPVSPSFSSFLLLCALSCLSTFLRFFHPFRLSPLAPLVLPHVVVRSVLALGLGSL